MTLFSNAKSPVKGILFDLDGVVIDSELCRDEETREFLALKGATYDRDKIKPLTAGRPKLVVAQIFIDEYQLDMSAEELVAEKDIRIQRIYDEEIPFVPGFMNFFERVREYFPVPVAIATGCDKHLYAGIDARLGLTDKFDGKAFRRDMVARGKPHPDVFLYAAKKIGVSASECGVLEDTPSGIAAGIRAGARVVALTRTLEREILSEKTSEILGRDVDKEILFIRDYEPASIFQVLTYLG